jgi:integrase
MADGRSAPPSRCVDDELTLVLAEVNAQGLLSPQSLARFGDLAGRFGRFVARAACGGSLRDVTADHARDFVLADSAAGPASVATMHLRRSLLRLLFRTGRRLGLTTGDPTLDLVLPRRSSLRTRPLENEEVALGRSAALYTLTGTRLAAAWALAEATARSAEIPRITVGDLDLDQRRVWLHGSGRTDPRWGRLSEWSAVQLDRHLRRLPDTDPDRRLVYRGAGSEQSQQATACIAIGDVLIRAGLATEPDVRPLSLVAWAGGQILEETGRIEEVAKRLGMRSLDRTATLIGLVWSRS